MKIETLVRVQRVLKYGRAIKLIVVAALMLIGFAVAGVAYAKEPVEDEDAAM